MEANWVKENKGGGKQLKKGFKQHCPKGIIETVVGARKWCPIMNKKTLVQTKGKKIVQTEKYIKWSIFSLSSTNCLLTREYTHPHSHSRCNKRSFTGWISFSDFGMLGVRFSTNYPFHRGMNKQIYNGKRRCLSEVLRNVNTKVPQLRNSARWFYWGRAPSPFFFISTKCLIYSNFNVFLNQLSKPASITTWIIAHVRIFTGRVIFRSGSELRITFSLFQLYLQYSSHVQSFYTLLIK